MSRRFLFVYFMPTRGNNQLAAKLQRQANQKVSICELTQVSQLLELQRQDPRPGCSANVLLGDPPLLPEEWDHKPRKVKCFVGGYSFFVLSLRMRAGAKPHCLEVLLNLKERLGQECHKAWPPLNYCRDQVVPDRVCSGGRRATRHAIHDHVRRKVKTCCITQNSFDTDRARHKELVVAIPVQKKSKAIRTNVCRHINWPVSVSCFCK
mmetsp:Transcript_9920/g.23071  ORF Transcript_9920/g.23071 Transcript_9920/m.23071 type:complete len:208 (+) Transcript_9920:100-723(+)